MIDLNKMKQEWKRKGFTDKDIADAIGIQPMSLSKKLNGHRRPVVTVEQYMTICKMLKSPMDMFVVKETNNDTHS